MRNDIIRGRSFTHEETGEIYFVNLVKGRRVKIRLGAREIADVSDALWQVALDLESESSNVQSACEALGA
jgi:hypothetical protein